MILALLSLVLWQQPSTPTNPQDEGDRHVCNIFSQPVDCVYTYPETPITVGDLEKMHASGSKSKPPVVKRPQYQGIPLNDWPVIGDTWVECDKNGKPKGCFYSHPEYTESWDSINTIEIHTPCHYKTQTCLSIWSKQGAPLLSITTLANGPWKCHITTDETWNPKKETKAVVVSCINEGKK